MIKKFFHNLNHSDVSYILISGQASVIYGAATFSEDIDLWIQPEEDNLNKFLQVLREVSAMVYKLTPPISMHWIQRGHGFHFQIPDRTSSIPFWFLDIMGIPPRAQDYNNAFERIQLRKTDWGKIPVLGIRDLVEIKKTRRLEDYSVISNLVRIEYENLSKKRLPSHDWKWILKNSFDVEDIIGFLESSKTANTAAIHLPRKSLSLCLKALTCKQRQDFYIQQASKEIAMEIEELRMKDRIYWGPIINDLKTLNKNGKLLKPGSKPPPSVNKLNCNLFI